MSKDQMVRLIKELQAQMKNAAKNLEFEKAAILRDKIVELRQELATEPVQPDKSILQTPVTKNKLSAKGAVKNRYKVVK